MMHVATCPLLIDISNPIFQIFNSFEKQRPHSFATFRCILQLASQAWCHMSHCDRYRSNSRKQSLPNCNCKACNCATPCAVRMVETMKRALNQFKKKYRKVYYVWEIVCRTMWWNRYICDSEPPKLPGIHMRYHQVAMSQS